MKQVTELVESGICAGFQLSTAAGPLCMEPMWGIAFEVEAKLQWPIRMLDDNHPHLQLGEDVYGPFFGQVEFDQIAFVKNKVFIMQAKIEYSRNVVLKYSVQVMTTMAAACRRALLENSPRLVEAMYLCEVSSSAEALAGVYAVLRRRRSRILRDEMREGSDTFIVLSYLPIEASFGLADELRKRTSGAASASLLLSHWERLQVGDLT